MKPLSLTLLSFSLAALLIGCSQESDGTALIPEIESIMIEGTDKVHAISINNEDVQLVGEITYSDSSIAPQTATHELNWESNDTKVLEIINGLLIPVANSGTVTITANYRDKIFSNSHTVSIIPITDLNITTTDTLLSITDLGGDKYTADIAEPGTYILDTYGIYADKNQTSKIITSTIIRWENNDTNISTINYLGELTVKSNGISELNVSIFNEINATVELNVTIP